MGLARPLVLGLMGVLSLRRVAGIPAHACSQKGQRPMEDFAGKIAVVTGGGSGMGRELVRQLAAAGASVAMCDVSRQTMEETKALFIENGVTSGVMITCHVVDVSDEEQVSRFRDEVAADHATDKIH